MPSPTGYRFRRALLPALVVVALGGIALSGCTEDRSHLIPSDDAQSLIERINEIEQIAADENVEEDKCFRANDLATEVLLEIERMDELDPELKRSLLRGVSRLQRLISNPEICVDQAAGETVEEPETEIAPEGPTGETGPTGPTGPGETTGEQGNDPDEDQDSSPPRNEETETRPPATPETNPTPPATNPGTGSQPGSGGLGPG